jgi:glutamate--cysteine ligase
VLHRSTLKSLELPSKADARFAQLAEQSLRAQRELEAADSVDFETFRRRYLDHDQLTV